jgi:hypothetical protein
VDYSQSVVYVTTCQAWDKTIDDLCADQQLVAIAV